MAAKLNNQIKDIRTEIHITGKKWYEFWKPKAYRRFIILYEDGTGIAHKVRLEK